ncbi:hypothetical protein J2X31_000225 [Flavobacterium arsenatis]|uniref:TonB-dependent receptor plug domain-containing protein n=1 Tax=Flavobacterium arsenatis TaxID=1484332 RepID=A0ABU1TLD3_9FLAO|nr:hypothetical protein [Flavobacterium arsenatis]MDR6966232.1 hypothetical protein [Flavobacterium arsenatis]
MNNFSEDESTISKITVINPSQGVKNYKKVNINSLKININPEGGNYVRGIENSMGISFLDCRNNSIDSLEGKLQNLNGEILRTFRLNRFGYAKIVVPPTPEKLKIVFNYNNQIFEKDLPEQKHIGLGLAVNNISNENKIFVSLNTNEETLKNLNNKKLFLVINKDSKSIIQEFSFKDHKSKAFTIETKTLFKGINTLRIIDGDLNQLCERLIYSDSLVTNYATPITIVKNKLDKEKISLVGYNSLSNSYLSLSTLPEKTKGNDLNKTTINVGLNINPYLKYPLENSSYYFTNRNRIKKIELDMVLVNQHEVKYDWKNMNINPPKSNYSFDIGLSIEGTIDDQIKNKADHKVKLLSYIDFINKQTDVTENGKFKIENLIVIDSSYLNLSLLKSPAFKEVKTKLNTTILNRSRPFYKPFKLKLDSFEDFEYETITYEYPSFSNEAIKLEDVLIKNKKPELIYENKIENRLLKGYKMEERHIGMSLLQFIRYNGFTVNEVRGDIFIYSRRPNTINSAQSEPEINIDGIRVLNFNELYGMNLTDIDEIFLSRSASPIGMNNRQGIINIFTKKPEFEDRADNFKFFIGKGFSEPVNFKQEKYTDTSGKGFDNYGVIGWSPYIISNEGGQFLYEISNLQKEKVIVDIEGININGEIIQQELILNLN